MATEETLLGAVFDVTNPMKVSGERLLSPPRATGNGEVGREPRNFGSGQTLLELAHP